GAIRRGQRRYKLIGTIGELRREPEDIGDLRQQSVRVVNQLRGAPERIHNRRDLKRKTRVGVKQSHSLADGIHDVCDAQLRIVLELNDVAEWINGLSQENP